MTLKDVDELERQRTEKYRADQQQLKADYEGDLYAFKRVRDWLREGRMVGRAVIHPPGSNGTATPSTAPQPTHHPEFPLRINEHTVEGKVLATIAKFNDPFTLEDLYSALAVAYPAETFNANTVNQVVFKLQDQALQVVTAGRRGQVARYKKL